MFYYYGRKKRIANLYPEPLYKRIIEPFAGSGAYSLHGERWKKEVYLYDTNDVVVKIWEYLLSASFKDIESLPEPEERSDLRNFKHLSQAEKYLIGFAVNPGSASPRNIVTHYSRWSANKKYILGNLHKIKHWKIENKSFETLDNFDETTWFIDPPYKKMGVHYKKNVIDYNLLSKWIISRKGQVIACEGVDADYLDFKPLTEFKAVKDRISKEFIYVQ